MTTLFRLPDNLGGHRVQIAGQRGDGQVIAIPDIDHGDEINRTEVHIAREKLVEVEPPLPPEPANDGTFVVVHSPGLKVWVFSRRQAVYTSMGYAPDGCDYWWWHEDAAWVTWAQICGMGEPEVLVPEVVREVPALPYVGRLGTRVAWEELLDGPRVYLTQGLSSASFSPTIADSLAELGAVITAAAARLSAAREEAAS